MDEDEAVGRVDGRSLRKTGRTHQFATRIREETHHQMKVIAARDSISLAELIEMGAEAYERERGRPNDARTLLAMWASLGRDEQREFLRLIREWAKDQT
jgi:predicted DNA-binding ribbon-helix-helix protein